MPYSSNLPAITSRMKAARGQGLLAAAAVVENEVKERLRGGYTSGDFVTGASLAAVAHSEPQEDGEGAFILVGTNLFYNLFWELGHMNLFTHRFERKEVWMPALLSTRQQQLAAFQRVYQTTLDDDASDQRVTASPRSPR